MPASKRREGLHHLDVGDLGSRRARRQACVIGLACHLGALVGERVVDAGAQVGERRLQPLGSVGLRLLDLAGERVELGLDRLLERRQGRLDRLPGTRHHLAGGREDEVLGDRLAGLLEGRLGLLAGCGQLLATGGHLLVGPGRIGLVLGGDLRALLGHGGLQLGALGLDQLAGAADPIGHLLVNAGERLLALLLVDARDDVQREVQDPLQVARAHVEQDSQA
jgi:hypothetical protein